MKQLLLPLFKRVLFVDWHGVASNDPFFLSILEKTSHPLNLKLKLELNKLFKNNDKLIRSWMRGETSYKNIVDLMGIALDKRFKKDYLARKIIEDCKLMKVNANLMNLFSKIESHVFIVLATDNMDCFFHYLNNIRKSKYPNRILENEHDMNYIKFDKASLSFDDILCSSNIGVLKRENPKRFFGSWLKENSLDFKDSLLLDDIEENCSAFRNAGGKAFRIDNESLDSRFESFKKEVIDWALNSKRQPKNDPLR